MKALIVFDWYENNVNICIRKCHFTVIIKYWYFGCIHSSEGYLFFPTIQKRKQILKTLNTYWKADTTSIYLLLYASVITRLRCYLHYISFDEFSLKLRSHGSTHFLLGLSTPGSFYPIESPGGWDQGVLNKCMNIIAWMQVKWTKKNITVSICNYGLCIFDNSISIAWTNCWDAI